MSSREDTPEPGTSAANDGRENPACPECRDADTACSSSCRHCFCRLCLWDWSLGQATCPRCHRPTRHPYPQHVALYHEVQERVYDGKQRRRSCSGRFGRGRPWERRRRRSLRWPRDGRRQSRHGHGSDSPRGRWWWRQRRAPEDTRGEGRAPRFEWDVPASSRESRSRRRSRRSWGQRRWSRGRERSHSRDRRWGRSSRRQQHAQTGSQSRSARQRRWSSWNDGDRHAARPQHDGPSGRSETPQWEDSDSSGHRHATRRRSRGRSHRRGWNSRAGSWGTVPRHRSRRQRRWRSWNADRGRAPRSRRDIPRSSWSSWDRSRSRAGNRDT